ncbi:MAG: hypothetical protein AAFZ01_07900 [Pseudomonadota bacterium]
MAFAGRLAAFFGLLPVRLGFAFRAGFVRCVGRLILEGLGGASRTGATASTVSGKAVSPDCTAVTAFAETDCAVTSSVSTFGSGTGSADTSFAMTASAGSTSVGWRALVGETSVFGATLAGASGSVVSVTSAVSFGASAVVSGVTSSIGSAVACSVATAPPRTLARLPDMATGGPAGGSETPCVGGRTVNRISACNASAATKTVVQYGPVRIMGDAPART